MLPIGDSIMATYFSTDGSYGDANGLIIVNTNAWPQDDWDKIEAASDWERPIVALEIAAENGDL